MPRRDSNPQFQQAIGCRPKFQNARPLGSPLLPLGLKQKIQKEYCIENYVDNYQRVNNFALIKEYKRLCDLGFPSLSSWALRSSGLLFSEQ
jgi:hypothetical protein